MFTLHINDRIQGLWALVAPTVNDACIQMAKLEEDPETMSYKITDHYGKVIYPIGDYFGWRNENHKKGIQ